MTPSGVSVLIRELERQLGFRLFDRTTRQVEIDRLRQRSPGSHAAEPKGARCGDVGYRGGGEGKDRFDLGWDNSVVGRECSAARD